MPHILRYRCEICHQLHILYNPNEIDEFLMEEKKTNDCGNPIEFFPVCNRCFLEIIGTKTVKPPKNFGC